jgi:hypothetical protein
MREFNWSPGIGDPTIGGWITVALYLVTAYVTWQVGRRFRASGSDTRSEAMVWAFIALLFLALGINKQLDLQSALTELGRVLAHAQGWYDNRFVVQVALVVTVAAISLVTVIGMTIMIWRSPFATWVAVFGTGLVLVFVAARAASFHHMDYLLSVRFIGLRLNWILEMSGISIVLLAALLRR